VFIFVIIFIKYGIGGIVLYENIQNGRAPSDFNPIVPPHGTQKVRPNPPTGPGVTVARRPPNGYMPRYPPPSPGVMMTGPPNGYMPRYPPPSPSVMMTGPPGSMMMMPGPRGPMMVPGPRGPMMMPGPRGPMMVPGPGDPMQGYYRQPVSHPPSAHLDQN